MAHLIHVKYGLGVLPLHALSSGGAQEVDAAAERVCADQRGHADLYHGCNGPCSPELEPCVLPHKRSASGPHIVING